jgi:hypothetical protein
VRKGESVFIRSVTYHYVGRVSRITRSWVYLEDASWVADSGRFGAALATGSLSEVERMPGVVRVARGAIVDVSEWRHALPVETRQRCRFGGSRRVAWLQRKDGSDE